MTTTQVQETTVELKQLAKTAWWIMLIQGIATLILGLMLFGQPGKTLLVLTTVLGTFWLITGILDVVAGIGGRTENSRTWTVIGGVITALAGLVVINQPLLAGAVSTGFLTFMIAFSIIINGVMRIFAGRRSPDGLGRDWSLGSLVVGILYVVGGTLLLSHPALTAITLLTFVAIWALVTGIAQVAFAFRIKEAAKHFAAT